MKRAKEIVIVIATILVVIMLAGIFFKISQWLFNPQGTTRKIVMTIVTFFLSWGINFVLILLKIWIVHLYYFIKDRFDK